MSRAARRPVPRPAAEPAARDLEPRTWQGVTFRPCQAGAAEVRNLFEYAGAWIPEPAPDELAWEAEAGGRLVGGLLVERRGAHGFVHGPVVVESPAGVEPLEVADQLLAPLLAAAAATPLDTLFTRPQGLDRLWVRRGFVPVPEAALPPGLRDRPGIGLFAWRRPGTYAISTPDEEASRRRRGR